MFCLSSLEINGGEFGELYEGASSSILADRYLYGKWICFRSSLPLLLLFVFIVSHEIDRPIRDPPYRGAGYSTEMALKSPRFERKSQTSCSTVTVVVSGSLCLIGVWVMISSSLTPVPTVNMPSESRSEMKVGSQPFDDSSHDLSQGETREDNDKTPQEDNTPKIIENIQESIEEAPEKQSSKDKGEELNEDMRRGDAGTNSGGQTDSHDKNIEQESANGDKQQSQSEEQQKDQSGQNGQTDSQDKNLEQESADGNKQQSQSEEQQEDQSGQNGGSEKQPKTEDASGKMEDSVEEAPKDEKQQSPSERKDKGKSSSESFPDPAQSELLKETNIQSGTWRTQDTESKNEKDAQKLSKGQTVNDDSSSKGVTPGYNWKLCNVTAGADYIPCLDNEDAIKHLRTTKHYEHRERHCPQPAPTCLVPLPKGYKRSIEWPKSRDKIWYYNVPHTKLVEVKGHQNWVKVNGEHLIFPGGGTQFKNGAQHYIEFLQELEPNVAWGNRSRVILDVGCGVASFGGYLFDDDVLTMSFAPKDEHEAQVQFALERGIPAISAVMGTQRLPFPSKVFDAIHCARCRVPWHVEGGKLLLELNRLLRPGGYFIWSATPVYQHDTDPEDAEIWQAMKELTKAMCWDVKNIHYDKINEVGAAIYQKPSSNDCYESREENKPPMCHESEDPNAAWYVPLQSCMHKVPVSSTERGTKWPMEWPLRLQKPPYWLNASQTGVYGKPAPDDFKVDYEHWQRVVNKSYLKGLGINWSTVRNVMDMRSVYGGFAAALIDLNIWVMNVVPVDSADTLPIIYERGLFGIYHDWCESFSTYPRTYDLLHADHLFSKVQKCDVVAVVTEADRILRPEGKLIVRDEVTTIGQIESLAKSMQWDVRLSYSKDKEGLLCLQKTMWRPQALSAT